MCVECSKRQNSVHHYELQTDARLYFTNSLGFCMVLPYVIYFSIYLLLYALVSGSIRDCLPAGCCFPHRPCGGAGAVSPRHRLKNLTNQDTSLKWNTEIQYLKSTCPAQSFGDMSRVQPHYRAPGTVMWRFTGMCLLSCTVFACERESKGASDK